MDCYIRKLPLEIQSLIRDDMPFCRLSKNHFCGKNQLLQLSQKSISQNEFLRYVDQYQPNYFFMYHETETDYHVIEITANDVGSYNVVDNHLSNDMRLIRVPNIIKKKDLYKIMKYPLEYDLVSTKAILQLRGEYINKQILISHLFNKASSMEPDLSFHHLKVSMYIASNGRLMNGQNPYGVLTVPLSLQLIRGSGQNTMNQAYHDYIDIVKKFVI